MGYSPWKLIKLDEIIEINPRISLKKGEVAKKIAMADIKEFTRKVQHYELTEFTSGSKFQNNDTLMARITPCLENGKTAFMDVLDGNEAAFGSTEFFILRAKERLADPKFIYYLSITEELRSVVIQSMTGTSGRQRAQRESILNYEMRIPPIGIQKKIGEILSILDDKIELNLESISTLERLAQTLFKRWFVDFEFPNENGEPYKSSGGEMVESELGMIPKGWNVKLLSNIAEITYGKAFKSNLFNEDGMGLPLIRIRNIKNDYSNKYTTEEFEERYLIRDTDILIGMDGEFSVNVWKGENSLLNQRVVKITKHSIPQLLLYFALKRPIEEIEFGKVGTTVIHLSKRDVDSIKLIVPEYGAMKMIEDLFEGTLRKIVLCRKENFRLEQLRNALLPKLLSGEIEIPDETEVTENVPIS